jgi:transposase-like protein
MGFKERGRRMEAEVIPNIKTVTLREAVFRTVEPGSRISTDELLSYDLLTGAGFDHHTVRHGRKEYAGGETHVNSVEGFWKIFKGSINSTHIHLGQKHMARYLGEFSFRSNHREMRTMFDLLIAAL